MQNEALSALSLFADRSPEIKTLITKQIELNEERVKGPYGEHSGLYGKLRKDAEKGAAFMRNRGQNIVGTNPVTVQQRNHIVTQERASAIPEAPISLMDHNAEQSALTVNPNQVVNSQESAASTKSNVAVPMFPTEEELQHVENNKLDINNMLGLLVKYPALKPAYISGMQAAYDSIYEKQVNRSHFFRPQYQPKLQDAEKELNILLKKFTEGNETQQEQSTVQGPTG